MTENKVGYIINRNPGHSSAGHPESPERFRHFDQLRELPIANSLERLDQDTIEEELLTEVHPRQYLERLKEAISRAPTRLDAGDTYVTKSSWQAAIGSASAAVKAANYGMEANQIGMSLSRPPGHHATATTAMGFCLLNNVALAARHLQSLGFERILIVDFDVHHGNGTQAIFEDKPEVFYFSTHQRGIFPGTGHLEETGIGAGEGTVQNVPLPAFTGEQGYLRLIEPLLESISDRYNPECLLVSAGYDAHWRDPLANLQFSCRTFYSIASLLRQIADQHCEGRMSLFLEGGYDPEALYHSIEHTLHGLLKEDPPEDPIGEANRPEADLTNLMDKFLHL